MADAAAPGPRRGWEVRGDVVARRVERVVSCKSYIVPQRYCGLS